VSSGHSRHAVRNLVDEFFKSHVCSFALLVRYKQSERKCQPVKCTFTKIFSTFLLHFFVDIFWQLGIIPLRSSEYLRIRYHVSVDTSS
jgi:hypothetical protein